MRPSYRRGIECIALNDEPDELDVEALTGYLSVGTLAAAFDVDEERVARDVVAFRIKAGSLKARAWVQ